MKTARCHIYFGGSSFSLLSLLRTTLHVANRMSAYAQINMTWLNWAVRNVQALCWLAHGSGLTCPPQVYRRTVVQAGHVGTMVRSALLCQDLYSNFRVAYLWWQGLLYCNLTSPQLKRNKKLTTCEISGMTRACFRYSISMLLWY